MDWKLHIISSLIIFTAVIISFPLGITLSAASLLAFLFFSLFPDIDHPKSVIRKAVFSLLFYFSIMPVVIFLDAGIPEKLLTIAIYGCLIYSAFRKIPLSHRGRRSLHRWRYALISTLFLSVPFLLIGIDPVISAFVFLGYSSHLLFDRIREF